MTLRLPVHLFFLGFVLSHVSLAATVSGIVTDAQNQPVPFCSVYIKGTTIGTTANADGKYSLEVQRGEYEIVFRSIGYKLFSKSVTVGSESIVVDVTLQLEAYQLKEALVSATAEDPAYAIIRKAIKKRKFYLNQVESFSCKAYVKSIQKLNEHPKKFMGTEVNLGDAVDSTTGIFYLSESVSNLHYKRPHQTKEEMISSKVSGSSRSFSFNQASDLLFNFYENLITIDQLAPRGIVSPVSATAMLYYNYRLEGTFIENGETINRIKVIPKRKHDPVFTGDIFIMDDSWRIHSLDLFITKDQQLEFIDTFRFRETYVPVEKDVWMLFNSQFDFVFGVFGFHGRGQILGIMSNYNIHPDFAPHFFAGEVMRVNRDANKKDSLYWQDTRPVPLTHEETRDYVKRDSTFKKHYSKEYKDSVDRKANKFSVSEFILAGYRHQNSFEKSSVTVSGLLQNVQFNTVEGLALGMNVIYRKREEDEEEQRKRFSLSGDIQYGFSNHHLNGNVSYRRRYNPKTLASYSLAAGTNVVQFNSNDPISSFINTDYSLLAKKNYMKIYEKRFASIAHRSELFNGVTLALSSEYDDRLPLVNTTDYSFYNKSGVYSSNDPLHPATDTLHFIRNQSFTVDAKLRIRFKQKYISRPEGKFPMGSDYPVLTFSYLKAIPSVAGSDANYDLVNAQISDERHFGLFGGLRYSAMYGKFLTSNSMSFMDYHHFDGNQTFLSNFRLYDFELLDYYKYSTNADFIEAHGEYSFGGFILNKIPLLRNLKLNEVAGVHFFHTPSVNNYVETFFGIEKLRLLRADFVLSFMDGKKVSTGFVFGLKVNLINGGIRLSD